MPIEYPKPPTGLRKALSEGLEFAADLDPTLPKTRSFGGAAAEKPHKVYAVGLKDAAKGKGLSKARLVAWRCLANVGSNNLALDIATNAGGTKHEFTGVNKGPYVNATTNAIKKASKLAAVKKDKHEVALVQIPALYIVALWLQHKNREKDIVVPLEPAPANLKAGKGYTVDEFNAAIVDDAKKRLDFDDTPGGAKKRKRR